MVIIAAGTLLGILSGLVALILQFRLPLWERLAGFASLDAQYRSNLDEQPLRRRLSVVFYFVALGFLGGTIAVAIKSLSPEIAMPVFAGVLLLGFDAALVAWRRHDRNERDPARSRGTRLLVTLIHVFFAVVVVLVSQ